MRQYLKFFLIIPIITIKLAFIYIDEKDSFQLGINKRQVPTFRVSAKVYPNVSNVKFTGAISIILPDGEIKPEVIIPLFVEKK